MKELPEGWELVENRKTGKFAPRRRGGVALYAISRRSPRGGTQIEAIEYAWKMVRRLKRDARREDEWKVAA